MQELSKVQSFGGWHIRFTHPAATTQCSMTAAIYLPPQAEHSAVPALYWLSGLTCNDENFSTKAGAQQYAAQHGIALIAPDTSPRGDNVPDDDGYDLGCGAGFYLSATQPPWQTHYQMDKYIVSELPALISQHFAVDNTRRAISGHSMGGHGALTIALKNPTLYRSVSAFAPICSPINCPWGQKALTAYLGSNQDDWANYDTCQLIKNSADAAKKFTLLVEQGEGDNFLHDQLKPHLLQTACQQANYPLDLRMRDSYDHSYYFIASFIGDHIRFHAEHLTK